MLDRGGVWLPQRGAGQRPAKIFFAKAHDSSKIQLGAMSN